MAMPTHGRAAKARTVLIGSCSVGLAAAAVAMNIDAAFPVVSRPAPSAAAALRTLGYTSTPIVVVSDASERVRFVAPFDHILSAEHAERLLKDLGTPSPGDAVPGGPS